MGRRTTSTTKGGKFMNSTDQTRKEARRRELKKNKKQRIAIRQAIIKSKDPQQMVKELEDLDDMELNPGTDFHYNEKDIKDKRRKLLETLVRIVDFYCKDDFTRGREFKAMTEMYKNNRLRKEMYYESVKNAQTVEITNIPLPDAPFETPRLSDIPLPGIQSKSTFKKQPLCPPSMPPNLMQRPEILPPGPPPGRPPTMPLNINRRPDFLRVMDRKNNEGRVPDREMRMMKNHNILSAPPSLIHQPEKEADETQAATIVAKPKLTTNPKVDSCLFTPTLLRVRRETKRKGGKSTNDSASLSAADRQKTEKKKRHYGNTADAVYDTFMKEMQGLS